MSVFRGGMWSGMFSSPVVIAVLSLGACLFALIIYIALLSRHRKAGADEISLVGTIALAETALEPEGAVIVRGELWRARLKWAESSVRRGERVRITGASGHLLEVEPVD